MSILFSLLLMFIVGFVLLMKLRSIAKLILDDDFKKGMIWATILNTLLIFLDERFLFTTVYWKDWKLLIFTPIYMMSFYYIFLFGAKVIKWVTSIEPHEPRFNANTKSARIFAFLFWLFIAFLFYKATSEHTSTEHTIGMIICCAVVFIGVTRRPAILLACFSASLLSLGLFFWLSDMFGSVFSEENVASIDIVDFDASPDMEVAEVSDGTSLTDGTEITQVEGHYRDGTWVDDYYRSDGTFVEGHYRRGSDVVSHFRKV